MSLPFSAPQSNEPEEVYSDEQHELARFARALGHPARIAIINLLLEVSPLNCQQMVDRLPLAQATVSQHLKSLRDVGVVRSKPLGTQVRYFLVPERMDDWCHRFRLGVGQEPESN